MSARRIPQSRYFARRQPWYQKTIPSCDSLASGIPHSWVELARELLNRRNSKGRTIRGIREPKARIQASNPKRLGIRRVTHERSWTSKTTGMGHRVRSPVDFVDYCRLRQK